MNSFINPLVNNGMLPSVDVSQDGKRRKAYWRISKLWDVKLFILRPRILDHVHAPQASHPPKAIAMTYKFGSI